MDKHELPALLGVSAVAKILNVSTDTVRRLLKDGELASGWIGGSIRIARGDLDAFLRASGIAGGLAALEPSR